MIIKKNEIIIYFITTCLALNESNSPVLEHIVLSEIKWNSRLRSYSGPRPKSNIMNKSERVCRSSFQANFGSNEWVSSSRHICSEEKVSLLYFLP